MSRMHIRLRVAEASACCAPVATPVKISIQLKAAASCGPGSNSGGSSCC